MKTLIIGDSFVEGVDAAGKYGWAQQFKDHFVAHDVVISGIGGDNIEKILKRLNPYQNRFDCVLLEVGVNDSRYRPSKDGNEIEMSKFADDLIKFIRYFRTLNSNVFIGILGLTRVDEKQTAPYKEDKYYLNKNIIEYDKLIEDVCKKEKVVHLPVPTLLDSDGLLSDGIHPSTKGHKILFQSILDLIGEQL